MKLYLGDWDHDEEALICFPFNARCPVSQLMTAQKAASGTCSEPVLIKCHQSDVGVSFSIIIHTFTSQGIF